LIALVLLTIFFFLLVRTFSETCIWVMDVLDRRRGYGPHEDDE
jgi:hypothetical protein